ncbi:sensor histidine kinase [Tenacibaculum adriaticum]|uniref:sensor histidine kinase n=1 Tax=Tenacibaculum adriaticum TaxID=413713 RepID=UPI0011E6E3AD|nr:tetratricopeptide repeat-containing sensor histidine kinase [Tenacibaculum adriaticum]
MSISQRKYELANKLYEEEEYSKALKMILPITEGDNNQRLKAKANLLIGKILIKTENYKGALNYLRESLLLLNVKIDVFDNMVVKDLSLIKADNYLHMSAAFFREKRKDSALYYLKELIGIESINKDVVKLKGDAYSNLAAVYINDSENLDQAKIYLEKAIGIHERFDNKILLAGDYSNLASIYVQRKEYQEAKVLYKEALKFLENETTNRAIDYKELLYDNLAWSLYNLKDYTAYEYVTKSYDIRDSLNDNKLKAELKKIELRHNIDLIRKEEENKRLRLERNTWLIGVIGVLVSLLLLYLANLYKLKQKDLNLQLSKSELEQQRNLEKLKSESQVKILNAALDGKETERKQIAETLHDNVSALLSSANMHLQASQKQFGKETPIEIQKTQEIILEASQKIRDLSHNLVSSVLLKFGLGYAIKDAAKKYSNSEIKIHTAITNIDRYSQDFEIKIFNIVQELINNILKHSKATNAYITIEEENSKLLIIVKDNGLGFENNGENTVGIGLNQIQARIHIMKGTFVIESSIKQGTKAMIEVPYVKRDESNFASLIL